MSDFVLYLWVVAGVLASLLLPIIWKAAFPDTPLPQGFGPIARELWPEIKPYCLIAIVSLLIALVSFAIVKSSGGQFAHWNTAFLNGYFWDSTLQKFKSRSGPSDGAERRKRP